MPVQLLSPTGMAQPVPYHHVAIGTGTRQVHVAGQVGSAAADGSPLAPDDLAGQVADALRNTATGLAGAGATFADVVRLTVYVARWRPERMGEFLAGVEAVAAELGLPSPMPPASLIGVDVLYQPEVLVEIEATAVLP
ncbi:RidA family protein [Cellulomonas triticagri]|uniref:RidA family protein n=1 Tax=Cellulomonas triticagri TaxID=2483352 RepID=A0A3M2JCZ7_9CELL|nr:Rid family hydrolase [Cellulomonas triticagri]RMI09453.1 RidA family protein [Cellulomonas triticagri]